METTEGLRAWLAVYVKGVFMGAAGTVPGVSAGTVALITGIYDRLVSAISSLSSFSTPEIARMFIHGELSAAWDELCAIDVPFLILLGAGFGTAVVALSRFMHFAIVHHPVPTNAFFLGLIGASAIVLYRVVDLFTPGRIVVGVTGFSAAFLVTGLSAGGGVGHGPLQVFLSGAIASAGMLLPGISGSAFLYILGQYEFMTGTLSSFIERLSGGGLLSPPLVAEAAVITVFMLGFTAGILAMARAVRWSLENYRGATMTGLVSLMIGALRLPLEEIESTSAGIPQHIAPIILPLSLGILTVFALELFTEEIQY